ncbi:deoxyribonuclease IV [Candidatus Falkowbacteria bacterium]|nr:deoxyribonuclease IV [Candidatus Falkowbacteria bacterium]
MLFGSHVSIAGGIEIAPLNAAKLGCEVFQMFSRSPRGGKPTYTKKSIDAFKQNCGRFKFATTCIHSAYYINLASTNNKIRYASIASIKSELDIANKLGVAYVITHIGSAGVQTEKQALKLAIKSFNQILDGYAGATKLLLENSAGAGKIIGDSFDEIGYIIKNLKNKNVGNTCVGVCLDTCHAFVSGYDLRTNAALNKTLQQFNNIIGLSKLKVLHLNDAKAELGSRKDRHEDIGKGKIGLAAFKLLINHPKLKKLAGIIETPAEKISYAATLKLLKKLRA